jgi:hypothetical protein
MAESKHKTPPTPAPKKPKKTAETKSRGRPTKYDPSYPELARKFCLLGADDEKLAKMFEVAVSTINEWKLAYPVFSESIKDGKDRADAMVAQSLYHRATGYSHQAVKIFADPKTGAEKIVKYTERYAPDATSAIFWLKNRQGWRDKIDVANTHTFEEMSDSDLEKARNKILEKHGVLPKSEG